MPNKTRLIALIAALSAANAAFRIALTGGPPNVKPTAFLVIVGAVVAGPIPGFIIGWLSMTISDFFTSYGPGFWTVETSAGMAMVGLLAGLLWHKKLNLRRITMAVGGFALAVVFDIGTAVVDSFLYGLPLWYTIMGLYVPIPPFVPTGSIPYPFGLAHEATTAVLCGAFGPSLINQIRKIYH